MANRTDTQISSPKDNFSGTYHNISKLAGKNIGISLSHIVGITSSQYVTT